MSATESSLVAGLISQARLTFPLITAEFNIDAKFTFVNMKSVKRFERAPQKVDWLVCRNMILCATLNLIDSSRFRWCDILTSSTDTKRRNRLHRLRMSFFYSELVFIFRTSIFIFHISIRWSHREKLQVLEQQLNWYEPNAPKFSWNGPQILDHLMRSEWFICMAIPLWPSHTSNVQQQVKLRREHWGPHWRPHSHTRLGEVVRDKTEAEPEMAMPTKTEIHWQLNFAIATFAFEPQASNPRLHSFLLASSR